MKKQYTICNVRTKRFGQKVLLTNDNGSWCFISKKEFKEIIKEELNKKTFKKLDSKGFIVTDGNITTLISKYRQKNSFLFQGTSLHIIVPTLRCNQMCIYCHASKKGANEKNFDMDEQTAKKTVDFIFQSPSKEITIEFQGGEPFMNFDIVKYIIEYAQEKNREKNKDLRFSIVTNLTLMTEQKLNYLIDQGVDICTSLDGPEYLHNINRPKDSYKIVTEWVKKLQKEYKLRNIEDRQVNALLTVTRDSLKNYKEIIDEYVKFGIKKIHLRFLNNLGDARPIWNKISYKAEDFLKFWKKSIMYINELNKGKKNAIIKERTFEIIKQKAQGNTDPNYLEMRSPCGAVIGQMTYNYDGKIYSCDEGRMIGEDIFMVGDVNYNTYNDVTTCSNTCALIVASTNDTQHCDTCAYKPYCGLCPVCNYAEQGNIISKIPITNRCKIYMSQFDHFFKLLLNDEKECL